ncbi:MAG: pyridoxamine 5-phosphate oxidase [Alphaproteobacteria bacterium]|nr:pyridoxamine 5-phosphate oxidase [Alphaproteobacteria bacterium]
MAHRYAAIAFTPQVRAVQDKLSSRKSYARMDDGEARGHVLEQDETDFIASQESFYMATVGATGWPYVQHRGGPVGLVQALDATIIGFADFRGNRQYISVGNLTTDDRVSLFSMDYVNRRRLKLFGRAAMIGAERQDLLGRLELPGYRARVERGVIITVEAFDWNCPQHITPRYTLAEMEVLPR